MLRDGVITRSTMLLHAQLGMAPLQQALLITDTSFMVPMPLPDQPAGEVLPAVSEGLTSATEFQ